MPKVAHPEALPEQLSWEWWQGKGNHGNYVHYTTYSERVGGQQKVKNKFNLICDEGPSCQHFQGHPAAIEIDRASKSLMSQGFQSLEFHPCIYTVILTIWTSGLKHYRINWHTFMASFLKLYKHVLQPKP